MAEQQNNPLLVAALGYARRGWRVLPCRETVKPEEIDKQVSKKAYIKDWPNKATTDEAKIREWWKKWPNALIAVCTSNTDLLVIDLDEGFNDDGSKKEGIKNFEKICKAHNYTPHTLTEVSPRGGKHLFYKKPKEVKVPKTDSKVATDIDVRGEKGYILVSPSYVFPHKEKKNGKIIDITGGQYKIIDESVEIEEAPQWLIKLCIDAASKNNEAKNIKQASVPQNFYQNIILNKDQNKIAYLNQVLSELDTLRSTPQGQRNNCLFKVAIRLFEFVKGGELAELPVRQQIDVACNQCGLYSNSEETVKTGNTLASAWSGASAKTVPDNPRFFSVVRVFAFHAEKDSGLKIESVIETSVPGFYLITEGERAGLWVEKYEGQAKDGEQKKPEQIRLGPVLEVLADSSTSSSENWSVLTRWKDRRGTEHKRLIPKAALVKKDPQSWLGDILASGGWTPSTSNMATGYIKKYLQASLPEKIIHQVERSGWHDMAFILPTEAIGKASNEEIFFDGIENTAFEKNGTLEEWKASIGEMSKGNSRMLFAVSAAFVAPLLGPCDAESGGVIFVGDSSTGKTTIEQAAASVWGKGSESGGYIKTWRATANALEGIAAEFSDCPLCLDELGQVNARELGEMAYMIANGQGKARAKRSGATRQIKTWRTLVIGTSENSMKEIIEGNGGKTKAGQEVRFVCIPADAGAGMGAFENLHGQQDAGSFAKAIKAATVENYGHASTAFIEAFIAHREEVIKKTRTALTKQISMIFPSPEACTAADGQVIRVAARFFLIGLAGEFALKWEIVPWTQNEAFNAAKRCFCDWLAERGGTGSAEETSILRDVISFLMQNGQSRFQKMGEARGDSDDKILNRVGFREVKGVSEGSEKTHFYILPELFHEICAGHNVETAKRVLKEHGLLIPGKAGKNTKNKRLPGFGQKKCIELVMGSDDVDS